MDRSIYFENVEVTNVTKNNNKNKFLTLSNLCKWIQDIVQKVDPTIAFNGSF